MEVHEKANRTPTDVHAPVVYAIEECKTPRALRKVIHGTVIGDGMTYLEAAIAVLKRTRRPMTVREITEYAMSHGYIVPQGKTPELTMSATLYIYARDIDTPTLRRTFQPGPTRAARNSV